MLISKITQIAAHYWNVTHSLKRFVAAWQSTAHGRRRLTQCLSYSVKSPNSATIVASVDRALGSRWRYNLNIAWDAVGRELWTVMQQRIRQQSPFWATVAEFGDYIVASVDRALAISFWRQLRQLGLMSEMILSKIILLKFWLKLTVTIITKVNGKLMLNRSEHGLSHDQDFRR